VDQNPVSGMPRINVLKKDLLKKQIP